MTLDDLIAEYVAAAECGDAPAPADFLARHPGHAAQLAAFLADFSKFALLLGLKPPTDRTVTADAGGPRAPDPDAEPFGGYELLGEVGRGGMGTVYRARIRGTALVVALKQLPPETGGSAARFREEIESAAGLRHPNIVPVYHVGEQDGRPFFTMELVAGGSLDKQLARFQSDFPAAVRLAAKVARAVHFAHQRRVLHRDLKPANILLDEAGEPHVADFGLAAKLDESGAAAGGAPAGSLPWMAPEAVRGDPTLTTGVDVWALGVILYELLTGKRPFPGDTRNEIQAAILKADPPPPRAANPRVPRDLDAISRRCLAKNPDRRYESASAVALELERWLRDEPVRARPAGRGERVGRWCRRNPGLAAGTVALLMLMVTGTAGALLLAREQDAQVRAEVCRGNEYAARGVAASVLWRLGELGDAVLETTDSPRLQRAVSREDWDEVRALLEERQRAAIPSAPGRPAFVTVYLLDPGGTIRAEFPPGRVEGKSFRGRDYFHRAVALAGRAGRDRVHVSRVFRSENDGLDKLAVSVPFRGGGPGSPVWVLGATITTDSSLGLGNLHDGPRQTVLIAARDPNPPQRPPAAAPGPQEYVVLVHHGYEPGQQCVPFRGGVLRPPTAPPADPELRFPGGGASFEPDDDFADPLAGVNPAYAGRWLAGSAAVGNTELVVLVEQRYADAVAPQRAFLRRFLGWAGGLIAAGLVAAAASRVWWKRTSRRG